MVQGGLATIPLEGATTSVEIEAILVFRDITGGYAMGSTTRFGVKTSRQRQSSEGDGAGEESSLSFTMTTS